MEVYEHVIDQSNTLSSIHHYGIIPNQVIILRVQMKKYSQVDTYV